MKQPDFIEIFNAVLSPIGWIILFAFAGLGWAVAIQYWKQLKDYAKRLGREGEL